MPLTAEHHVGPLGAYIISSPSKQIQERGLSNDEKEEERRFNAYLNEKDPNSSENGQKSISPGDNYELYDDEDIDRDEEEREDDGDGQEFASPASSVPLLSNKTWSRFSNSPKVKVRSEYAAVDPGRRSKERQSMTKTNIMNANSQLSSSSSFSPSSSPLASKSIFSSPTSRLPSPGPFLSILLTKRRGLALVLTLTTSFLLFGTLLRESPTTISLKQPQQPQQDMGDSLISESTNVSQGGGFKKLQDWAASNWNGWGKNVGDSEEEKEILRVVSGSYSLKEMERPSPSTTIESIASTSTSFSTSMSTTIATADSPIHHPALDDKNPYNADKPPNADQDQDGMESGNDFVSHANGNDQSIPNTAESKEMNEEKGKDSQGSGVVWKLVPISAEEGDVEKGDEEAAADEDSAINGNSDDHGDIIDESEASPDLRPAPSILPTMNPVPSDDDDESISISPTQGTFKFLNVNSKPNLPFTENEGARKYLAYESHSGFHNQRKSLENAILLAEMLNRTLLLPPARLGSPAPWGPELQRRMIQAEECKKHHILHQESKRDDDDDDDTISQDPCLIKYIDPSEWTYVSWDYLLRKGSLPDNTIEFVDRWNSSLEWFYDSTFNGGLGLQKGKDRIIDLNELDVERRSYQIYETTITETEMGEFQSRINVEDLLASSSNHPRTRRGDGKLEWGSAKVLHFGSLFGGNRIILDPNGKWVERRNQITESIIFGNEKLEGISESISHKLGDDYIGVHMRVGDGSFQRYEGSNTLLIFTRLARNISKLGKNTIKILVDATTSAVRASGGPQRLGERSSKAHKRTLRRRSLSNPSSALAMLSLSKRGLTPELKCRGKLHKKPSLKSLNTPVYLATDSKFPLMDPFLQLFFRNYPCVFILDDFVTPSGEESSDAHDSTSSPEPTSDAMSNLIEMVNGSWRSDYDGHNLARYLYPFLEAMIAAKGKTVLGTPKSTFSGYMTGVLHRFYSQQRLESEAFPTTNASPPKAGSEVEEIEKTQQRKPSRLRKPGRTRPNRR